MLLQGTLFPDAFEIQTRALAQLDRLDHEGALRLVEEARAQDPDLVNLGSLHEALLWLRHELGGESVSDEILALLFVTVPEACRNGQLSVEAATLVDEVIARQGLARAGARAFLDPDETVHRGALLLVLRRAGEAHALLRETLGTDDGRGDLWAAFAEASHSLERLDEANAGYVRALLLCPRAVEPFRLRNGRLVELHRQLVESHGAASAFGLLLVHACLAGALTIPSENGWLDRHLSRLHLAAAVRPDSPPEQRLRRFSWLFYLDQSRAAGHYDQAEREEMQALDPELFGRVLPIIQARARAQTKTLRW